MTRGGGTPPAQDDGSGRSARVLGWRGRLETLQRALMRTPLASSILEVMRAYDRAGGGMLAGALAYFAFFTVVPTLLLFVSVLGILIEDAAVRYGLIDALVAQIDPIRPVAIEVINGLADSGRTGTIIGVLGLLWGASGFYGALQGAMQRMFPGPGVRDFLQTRLRGILTVALILVSMLSAVLVVFVLPLVTEAFEERCARLRRAEALLADELCGVDVAQVSWAIGPVLAMGVAFLAALVVFVAIAPDGPSVRQAFPPAVVAGIVIGLLTSLFGWIAPLFVRHWLTLGIVGSVFVALVWFNLVFQTLLFGAAFARLRRDRDRVRGGPPTL